MKLNTDSPFFLDGFCKACADHQLDEQTAGDLYHQARLTEAQTRPAFASGFAEGLQVKQASPLAVAGKVVRAGGTAAAASPAAQAVARRFPWLKALGLGGAAVGGVAAAPALSGANPLGAFSGLTRNWRRPFADDLQLPSWLPSPGDTPASTRRSGKHNPFSYIEGYAQPGASTARPDHPLSMVNNARTRIKQLDEQIQGLQGQEAGTGLAGTLAAGQTRQMLKQLQQERQKAMRQMSGTYFGGFSRDVQRGQRGVGKALGRTEDQLGRIRDRSEGLNRYLQKTEGSLIARPWNAITGVRGRAQGVLSRQQELERQREYLQARQSQLQAL